MKAVVLTQYGSADKLQLTDIEKPTPKSDEVLIKIHASSINAADKYLMNGSPFLVRLMTGGIFNPPKNKVLGADVAGIVEAIGTDVTTFKVGDEVFADISGIVSGGYAEYVAVPESIVALKPSNISFEQAASVPLAGVTALQGLRDHAQLTAGQKILINGASGGVGTFAVQLAKYYGAEVTATCSTSKVEMVRSIGADHVIDYKQDDFTKNGQQYDLIFDIAAYHSPADYKSSLKPQGKYILAGGSIPRIFQVMLFGWWFSRNSQQTIANYMANPNQEDLEFMGTLLESGKVVPVIDKCFPLEQTADAMRYFETGSTQGKVIISTLGDGSKA